jgi:acyl-CoA thioester hydrolase
MQTMANTSSSGSADERLSETRTLSTRWSDTDLHGHVSNAVYRTVQHRDQWLDHRGKWLQPGRGASHRGRGAVQLHLPPKEIFPQTLAVGIRFAMTGRTSVSYELRLLTGLGDASDVAAQAQWPHVYVERQSRRPVEIPEPVCSLLQAHQTPDAQSPGDGDLLCRRLMK